METRIQKDTRVVLSFTEEEAYKVSMFLMTSTFPDNVQALNVKGKKVTTDLEDFAYKIGKEINDLLEDKAV